LAPGILHGGVGRHLGGEQIIERPRSDQRKEPDLEAIEKPAEHGCHERCIAAKLRSGHGSNAKRWLRARFTSAVISATESRIGTPRGIGSLRVVGLRG